MGIPIGAEPTSCARFHAARSRTQKDVERQQGDGETCLFKMCPVVCVIVSSSTNIYFLTKYESGPSRNIVTSRLRSMDVCSGYLPPPAGGYASLHVTAAVVGFLPKNMTSLF